MSLRRDRTHAALVGVAVVLIVLGPPRTGAQSSAEAQGGAGTKDAEPGHTSVVFDDPLLVWELGKDNRLFVRSGDSDAVSPWTKRPRCTALKRPCPRPRKSRFETLALSQDWTLQLGSPAGDEALVFRVKGPRSGLLEVRGDDAAVMVKPRRSLLPWRPGTWSLEAVGDETRTALLIPDKLVVQHVAATKPETVQNVLPVTSRGDACWVEVPCPKRRR